MVYIHTYIQQAPYVLSEHPYVLIHVYILGIEMEMKGEDNLQNLPKKKKVAPVTTLFSEKLLNCLWLPEKHEMKLCKRKKHLCRNGTRNNCKRVCIKCSESPESNGTVNILHSTSLGHLSLEKRL